MNFGYFGSSTEHKRLFAPLRLLTIAAMMSWFILPVSVWNRFQPSLATSADTATTTEPSATTEEARVREIYGKLPLSFEVNAGQAAGVSARQAA